MKENYNDDLVKQMVKRIEAGNENSDEILESKEKIK